MPSVFHSTVEALSETFFLALEVSIERARARWSTPETLTVIKLGTDQFAFHLGREAGAPVAPVERYAPLRDLLSPDDFERVMPEHDERVRVELEGVLSECRPADVLKYLDAMALSVVAARVKRRFSSAHVFAFFNDENPFPMLLPFPNDLLDDEEEFEAVLTVLDLEPGALAVWRDLFRQGQATTERGSDPLVVGERFLRAQPGR